MLSDCNSTVDQYNQEKLRHGTAAFPLACYHDDLSRDSVPWHWHEELEAVLVTAGETLVTIGQRSFVIHAGERFFVNSGVLHSCQPAGSTPCLFHSLVFHPRLIGGSLESIFYRHYVLPITENRGLEGLHLQPSIPWHSEILSRIEQTWQACVHEFPHYELTARSRLSELLSFLVDQLSQEPVRSNQKHARNADRIKQMLQYIHDHFSEELVTADIAASAAVSESECLRCFRTVMDTTPIRYLREYRIDQAAGLLSGSHDPICDIAARCGFADVSYFTKTFRELKGCTPGAYREKFHPRCRS